MKKLFTFVVVLMISTLSFGSGLKFVWTGGPLGSWTDPLNWSVQPYLGGTATYPGQNNPADLEDWVIFNDGDIGFITNVPASTLGRLEISPLGLDATFIFLKGAADGVTLTFVKPAVPPINIWTIKIDDNCLLDCNSPGERVKITCNPGVCFWQKNNSFFFPAEDQNCQNFQGFLLKANATEHAEYIQQLACAQLVKGYAEYYLDDGNYHYISPPVTSVWPLADEFTSIECRTPNSLCVFDGDYLRKFTNGAGWDNWIGVADCMNSDITNIETGRGYEFYGAPGTGPIYTFYGTFNAGYPIVLPVNTLGWNLIGNPFTSAITFGEPSGASTAGAGWTWNYMNTDPTAYWWDNAMGMYRYYNWYAGDGNGTSLADVRVVPRSQGFFVHVSDFTPPISNINIYVSNEARVFRPSVGIGKSVNANTVAANTLNLSLNDAANTMIDNTRVRFREDANTTDFDRLLDVYKIFNDITNVSQLYSKTTDNIDVAMKSLKAGTGTIEYPVYLKVLNTGSYSIIAGDVNSFSSNTGIWLRDNKTNTTADLKANPVYTFSASEGDDDARFSLRFSNVLYGIDVLYDNTFKVYSNEHSIFIKNYDSKTTTGSVMVYDMIGRLMMQGNLNNNEITRINTTLNKGFYVVSVRTVKGIFNQKVYLN